MLTRIRLNKDYRLFVRFLADKSDKESKQPPMTKNKDGGSDSKSFQSLKDSAKIQELLKNMLIESKIKDEEYQEKFVIAKDLRKSSKKNSEVIDTDNSGQPEVMLEKIEGDLTKAAGEVAKVIGGDTKQTEAELLSRVLGKINQTSTTLSDLLIGMKVEHSKDEEELKPESRGQQVKRFVAKAKTDMQSKPKYVPKMKRDSGFSEGKSMQPISMDLTDGERLGIFATKGENFGTPLPVWEALKQRELTLVTAQPPSNYFQKMIKWTKEGKVWKFPIDNEQGLKEEQDVHFTEHVFLENHLEGWCPKKGPIRHYMELVCVGLSKNAFYTAKEKKEHIMWYKEYFESKKGLLDEIGAWDIKSSKTESKTST